MSYFQAQQYQSQQPPQIKPVFDLTNYDDPPPNHPMRMNPALANHNTGYQRPQSIHIRDDSKPSNHNSLEPELSLAKSNDDVMSSADHEKPAKCNANVEKRQYDSSVDDNFKPIKPFKDFELGKDEKSKNEDNNPKKEKYALFLTKK